MDKNDALTQAFINHPFEVLVGIAIIIILFFVGYSLLIHGWPKFRK
jgi:uncharacterized membrane protein YphA (DoxX/SURF4 family)